MKDSKEITQEKSQEEVNSAKQGNSSQGSGNPAQGSGNPGAGNSGQSAGNPGQGGGNPDPGQGNSNPGKGGDNNSGDKKISLVVIVNGTPTEVEANLHQKLHVIAQKALDQTANTGRPLSDWTLKTRDGNPLDLDRTVESYGFEDGTQLVLSLEAGVGGNL